MKNISFNDTKIAFESKSDSDIRRSYLLFAIMNQNWFVKLGTFFVKLLIYFNFPVKKIIKATIFKQFCGGESIEECQTTIESLKKSKIGTILDYSVEGEEKIESFIKTKNEIISTIKKAKFESGIPFTVFKLTGIFKTEALEEFQTENGLSEENKAIFQESKKLLEEICRTAYDSDVRLFIDAEESWIQDTIDQLTYEMMHRFNLEKPIIFNTYQMYRVDMYENLENAIKEAIKKKVYLGVKLVRGAYMEKERSRSHEVNIVDPIHKTKEDTDQSFNRAAELCLKYVNRVAFCLGTHNENSCMEMIQLMEKKGIEKNHPNIFFAQLLGMSDNISFILANNGYNVAKYVPYGPVKSVMPYLFRRAEENTSISGQSSREYSLLKQELKRRMNHA